MAYYDPRRTVGKKLIMGKKQKQKEAWEDLVIKAREKKEPDNILLAILFVEEKLKELEECHIKIKEYQKFFNTLKSFLPKDVSNRPLTF